MNVKPEAALTTYARQEQDGSPESELVERARSGDREAFGELVRRHRAQALGLAGGLTKDAHLAEDIVQEALIRAFLHLGTLADTSRFRPWFHRIVRNQANMKLRRGGPFGRERPFTSFAPANAAEDEDRSAGHVDWSDVDSILFHLARHASEEAGHSLNPEEHLMRRELLENIRLILHCLSGRERAIFEARFFGELQPAEIAAMFQTTSAGVYNSLSRSRAKLQKERIRQTISLYVQRRSELGLPRRKVLSPPHL
ncbi:RNA polymerase sigma factor [Paenibacillus humicola]|uniref:RNA polymerase sigma factor n=1 Tax=Paenibacillus humicola TaxID=3110540 RepID=UPI00237A6C99|nr:sigma-70 family RNA polymerase sigma factor [Paenibacillus humicola]